MTPTKTKAAAKIAATYPHFPHLKRIL